MSIKIAIAGSSGRMGRMLIEAVLAQSDCQLFAALDRENSSAVGQDASAFLGKNCGVNISANFENLAGADVLIDFTRPEGTLQHLVACQQHGVNMIIGTTGFDEAGKAAIQAAADKIAIVHAYNMSAGVNLLVKLLEVAAKTLNTGYDIEIVEMHHRMKVDAPSGTALMLGEAVAGALGRNLADCAVYDRQGITGERDPSSIGFATLRGGDVIGDHTVIFAGMGERIEISHKASNRNIYAQGSIRAARFLTEQTTGLFNMQDVLGLS
ncbi:4-hydroxy-tetrahydrodipicolinate reductase [Iodobacter fluviatilis]|uniref:4-hydroxy-tetrahydrodipicolinate reductase n=1 Tax=Iodobacter fluviatilis TaxID=537 RepID=A0A377Q4U1_9NEIS|nr:4-hydroxy-tetrahydrodipicolinate reductase [Iodobacter fluviatilis]TCU84488.1 dihydrodipicolinate reductase [Iodobacter fluviatilis]STQ89953.1 Dihydrodipicolinate reductase [Iodobacter fluviatilis]